mmetsp:Transcript_6479/g.12183  ORF Transcript_6479/g.12183 Transcript_6479/m.12183 type:complete len:293 (+) Transcript_6479:83-961(+)
MAHPSKMLCSLRLLGQRSVVQAHSLSASRFADSFRRSFATALKPVFRDPERPTKPPTPWLMFLNDFRQQQQGLLKGAPKEVMVAASARWKALPETDKKKYEVPYETQKQAFEQQMKVYVDSGKKDAWDRDPDRPKAPMTPFIRFSQDFRKSAPDLKMTEASKMAAESWKDLNVGKKSSYEKAYAADKEKHATELKAYQESGKEHAWKLKVGLVEKEEKLKAAKAKVDATKKAAKEKEAARKQKETEKQQKIKMAEKMKKDKEKAKEEKAKDKARKEKAAAKSTTKKEIAIKA